MSFQRASFSKQWIEADRQAYYDAALAENASGQNRVKRSLVTGGSVLGILTLIYIGLHYLPAFFSSPSATPSTQPTQVTMADKRDQNIISSLVDRIEDHVLRRASYRAGQRLSAVYAIPEDASLNIHIKRCHSLPIVEIVRCNAASETIVTISDKQAGRRSLSLPEDGFYHLSETISPPYTEADYQLVWTR
jgi:hypothetical protein